MPFLIKVFELHNRKINYRKIYSHLLSTYKKQEMRVNLINVVY